MKVPIAGVISRLPSSTRPATWVSGRSSNMRRSPPTTISAGGAPGGAGLRSNRLRLLLRQLSDEGQHNRLTLIRRQHHIQPHTQAEQAKQRPQNSAQEEADDVHHHAHDDAEHDPTDDKRQVQKDRLERVEADHAIPAVWLQHQKQDSCNQAKHVTKRRSDVLRHANVRRGRNGIHHRGRRRWAAYRWNPARGRSSCRTSRRADGRTALRTKPSFCLSTAIRAKRHDASSRHGREAARLRKAPPHFTCANAYNYGSFPPETNTLGTCGGQD